MNDYIWKTAFTNHEGKLYLLGALKRKKRNSHPFGACLNTSSDMNENIMTEDDDEGMNMSLTLMAMEGEETQGREGEKKKTTKTKNRNRLD